ncbi:gliding motility-associated C-terminal domain-containing protein [Confluentibacter sediminis]|uniref:gliding motility-associated C-terminal domain-containing protein n=1 Tax=Confluentibacter sediminis TaxID=2219045 RepID=UPI000DADE445|nr:gliding motility-associated C-terminal domain-containing protein [Confluentibacter sediminis]
MKKLYNKDTFTNSNSIRLVLLAVLILTCTFKSYGQVRVPFTPRTSITTPSSTVYHVKGDFTMIGNTNLTLETYSDEGTNESNMEYVDVDDDDTTLNSSSATLTLSNEDGAIPECSNIIYAGLYWTGRAFAEGQTDTNTFQVTKNSLTKTLDKRSVLLKGPSSANYTQISAINTTTDNKNIYFPSGEDKNIYSAYAEITDYVIENGIGEYFVADIATREGSADATGFFGGWGLVVVYENSKMKWRDVTVFDGHAFVNNNETMDNYDITISGFNAVKSGNVNVKIGLMAGEGDVPWTEDYFQILRQDNDTYQNLSHTGNTETNFFNSSIQTGGNPRNPNLKNNTGIDIAMFNIDNTNNGIIANNQTSTRFRYGSTLDTYTIFNLTFAIDSYVPEPEGVLTTTSINGNANPPIESVQPGEYVDYKIEIKNKGTEALNNAVMTIPLPVSVNPDALIIDYNTYAPFSTVNEPTYDPNLGVNGSIVWNLGTLPLLQDVEKVLADIEFRLTSTTNCAILSDPNDGLNISLNGVITGVGATSNVSFNRNLIQGYETSGQCIGESIPAPKIIIIDSDAYINEAPTASNPLPSITVECFGDIPAPDPNVVIGEADNSGIAPKVTFVSDVSDGGNNPEIITRTYSVTDDCGNSINVMQTITIKDTTAPVAPTLADLTGECSVTATAPTTTDTCAGTITGTTTDPLTYSTQGTFIINWIFDDGNGNSITVQQNVIVKDTTAPVAPTLADLTGECSVTVIAPTTTDNCAGTITGTTTDPLTYSTKGTFIINWIFDDGNGNSITVQQNVIVKDTTAPVAPTLADLTGECSVTVIAPTTTDNCAGTITGTTTDPLTYSTQGTFIINWTFDDGNDNSVTVQQNVIVTDMTKPTFVESLPVDITVECDAIPVAEILTAADNCGTASVTFNEEKIDGSCISNYILKRTWTATDASGLTETYTQTITVEDTKAPTVTTPFDEVLNVSCANIPEVPSLEFTDGCSGNVTVTFEETNSFNETSISDYQIVRTWTATDACGNFDTFIQTVNVTMEEVVSQITAEDRCYDDGVVDLNNYLSGTNLNGTWEIIQGDLTATLTDSVFDPTKLSINANFLPQDGGIDYVFRYTTIENGCISITELTMNINADCDVLPCQDTDVIISKAVTPNGDFRNDALFVSLNGFCGFKAHVKIFNRWGALVFESNNYPVVDDIEDVQVPPANSWDGSSKSHIGAADKLPNGTYYYIITFENSGFKPFTGPIYLATK